MIHKYVEEFEDTDKSDETNYESDDSGKSVPKLKKKRQIMKNKRSQASQVPIQTSIFREWR